MSCTPALMTIKQLLPQVILLESSQQNGWPFCEDTLEHQVSPPPLFAPSPPEVGVYKVDLIDESSANSLHLVRVWKSGEDVRAGRERKKSVT